MELNTGDFTNPQTLNVNELRNDLPNQDIRVLDELIKDANTGNDLIINIYYRIIQR